MAIEKDLERILDVVIEIKKEVNKYHLFSAVIDGKYVEIKEIKRAGARCELVSQKDKNH